MSKKTNTKNIYSNDQVDTSELSHVFSYVPQKVDIANIEPYPKYEDNSVAQSFLITSEFDSNVDQTLPEWLL